MSAYQFGAGKGTLKASRIARLQELAYKYQAFFIAGEMDDGPRYWFEFAPGVGDEQLANVVLAEAQKAGLL